MQSQPLLLVYERRHHELNKKKIRIRFLQGNKNKTRTDFSVPGTHPFSSWQFSLAVPTGDYPFPGIRTQMERGKKEKSFGTQEGSVLCPKFSRTCDPGRFGFYSREKGWSPNNRAFILASRIPAF